MSEERQKKTMSQACRDENLTILVANSIARNDLGSATVPLMILLVLLMKNIYGETAIRVAFTALSNLLANHEIISDFISTDIASQKHQFNSVLPKDV